MIKIGTSGYSFDDWVGPVYPVNINKKAMLRYYEEQLGFSAVELNYTYYSLPSQRSVSGILSKTSPAFKFSVKANKDMTHNIRDKTSKKFLNNKEIFEKFRYSLEPMIGEGRLSCILAQFPYSFHFNHENMNYLQRFREMIPDIPVSVEFRNRKWHNLDALDTLRKWDMSYCVVDEPKLEGLMPFFPAVTAKTAYVRLHGRNKNWFDVPTSVRYDYLYDKNELNEFLEAIRKIDKEAENTLVFFNNCHAGSAAKNAVKLTKMLDSEFQSIID